MALNKGGALFSTNMGKDPARAVPHPPPPVVARGDLSNRKVEVFARMLQEKFPKGCREVYNGFELEDWFDNHDIHMQDQKFLRKVLTHLALPNNNRVIEYAFNLAEKDPAKAQLICSMIFPSEEVVLEALPNLFEVEEIKTCGQVFLGHVIQHLKWAGYTLDGELSARNKSVAAVEGATRPSKMTSDTAAAMGSSITHPTQVVSVRGGSFPVNAEMPAMSLPKSKKNRRDSLAAASRSASNGRRFTPIMDPPFHNVQPRATSGDYGPQPRPMPQFPAGPNPPFDGNLPVSVCNPWQNPPMRISNPQAVMDNPTYMMPGPPRREEHPRQFSGPKTPFNQPPRGPSGNFGMPAFALPSPAYGPKNRRVSQRLDNGTPQQSVMNTPAMGYRIPSQPGNQMQIYASENGHYAAQDRWSRQQHSMSHPIQETTNYPSHSLHSNRPLPHQERYVNAGPDLKGMPHSYGKPKRKGSRASFGPGRKSSLGGPKQNNAPQVWNQKEQQSHPDPASDNVTSSLTEPFPPFEPTPVRKIEARKSVSEEQRPHRGSVSAPVQYGPANLDDTVSEDFIGANREDVMEVFVHNFPSTATASDVQAFFEKLVPVRDVIFRMDNRQTQFAFVHFNSAADARKALTLNGDHSFEWRNTGLTVKVPKRYYDPEFLASRHNHGSYGSRSYGQSFGSNQFQGSPAQPVYMTNTYAQGLRGQRYPLDAAGPGNESSAVYSPQDARSGLGALSSANLAFNGSPEKPQRRQAINQKDRESEQGKLPSQSQNKSPGKKSKKKRKTNKSTEGSESFNGSEVEKASLGQPHDGCENLTSRPSSTTEPPVEDIEEMAPADSIRVELEKESTITDLEDTLPQKPAQEMAEPASPKAELVSKSASDGIDVDRKAIEEAKEVLKNFVNQVGLSSQPVTEGTSRVKETTGVEIENASVNTSAKHEQAGDLEKDKRPSEPNPSSPTANKDAPDTAAGPENAKPGKLAAKKKKKKRSAATKHSEQSQPATPNQASFDDDKPKANEKDVTKFVDMNTSSNIKSRVAGVQATTVPFQIIPSIAESSSPEESDPQKQDAELDTPNEEMLATEETVTTDALETDEASVLESATKKDARSIAQEIIPANNKRSQSPEESFASAEESQSPSAAVKVPLEGDGRPTGNVPAGLITDNIVQGNQPEIVSEHGSKGNDVASVISEGAQTESTLSGDVIEPSGARSDWSDVQASIENAVPLPDDKDKGKDASGIGQDSAKPPSAPTESRRASQVKKGPTKLEALSPFARANQPKKEKKKKAKARKTSRKVSITTSKAEASKDEAAATELKHIECADETEDFPSNRGDMGAAKVEEKSSDEAKDTKPASVEEASTALLPTSEGNKVGEASANIHTCLPKPEDPATQTCLNDLDDGNKNGLDGENSVVAFPKPGNTVKENQLSSVPSEVETTICSIVSSPELTGSEIVGATEGSPKDQKPKVMDQKDRKMAMVAVPDLSRFTTKDGRAGKEKEKSG